MKDLLSFCLSKLIVLGSNKLPNGSGVQFEFLTGSTVQKGRSSSILFGRTFGTSSCPFDLLKDIFTKGAVSTCFLDLFQAHNLLVEATLFSSNNVHVCNLNNKAATWLHAAPSLK